MNCSRRGLALTFLAVALLTACNGTKPAPADILLFVGDGTSPGDVAATEQVLRDHQFSFATADTQQLDAMSEAQLHGYRLLIVPGRNFEDIGNRLSPEAASRIRNAVHGGVNYLGLCAGAFFAGNSPYNGLNLTNGVQFHFYAIEAQGVRKSAVPISIAGGATADHYWEDGPELSGWGEAIAKYPNGTPAIVQGSAGRGWMILAGVHPEAPEHWRRGLHFATSASADNAYAATLIAAALKGQHLSHY